MRRNMPFRPSDAEVFAISTATEFELDKPAVVSVCWDCDSQLEPQATKALKFCRPLRASRPHGYGFLNETKRVLEDKVSLMYPRGAMVRHFLQLRQASSQTQQLQGWVCRDKNRTSEKKLHVKWRVFGRVVSQGAQGKSEALETRRACASRLGGVALLPRTREPVNVELHVVYELGADNKLVGAAPHRLTPKPMSGEEDVRPRICPSEAFLPLSTLCGAQYYGAWVDIAEAFERLHKHGILHRDISCASFRYSKTGTTLWGALNDFDLASLFRKCLVYPPHLPRRTGTMPFLACEFLYMRNYIPHLLRHDLESALYVLIWDTVEGVARGGAVKNEHLHDWLNRKRGLPTKGALAEHLCYKQLPFGELDHLRMPLGGIVADLSLGYALSDRWWYRNQQKPHAHLEGDEKDSWECLFGHFTPETVVQEFRDLKKTFSQSQEGLPGSAI
ncbi:hypothetical protein BOTBODRAFT_255240 [Botryobasidium botryosum FD-172 SS1]|uniref:Fungal-type protein kinase domain-containing protein n=1 Tax=Botryobasidium botryosum (strain FD-172 SS1) TaxID=930990 RepID=A0A067LSW4_BOTB1|nr:hypothetical protein BOTBODRAFT_255240 [Botryobasidium botryosum FD-172 SS1]